MFVCSRKGTDNLGQGVKTFRNDNQPGWHWIKYILLAQAES